MKANIKVVAIEVGCPTCSEPISHPETGSQVWETVENRFAKPFQVTCICGQTLTVDLGKRLRQISY